MTLSFTKFLKILLSYTKLKELKIPRYKKLMANTTEIIKCFKPSDFDGEVRFFKVRCLHKNQFVVIIPMKVKKNMTTITERLL